MKAMDFAKGMGIGLAVGAAAGMAAMGPGKKKSSKTMTGRAVKAISEVMDSIADSMGL